MTAKKEMMELVDNCMEFNGNWELDYAKLESIADELENPFIGEYIDTIILGIHYHEYITSTGHRILVEQKSD